MPVLTFSAQLDINLAIIEEHPDGLKATAYFEDFLFKLFQDIEAINVSAGTVLGLTLPGTVFELEQSTGVSPRTVDLVSLDGRVTGLTLPGNVLTLAQSTGVSPQTVDLSGLDGRVTSLTLPANILTLVDDAGAVVGRIRENAHDSTRSGRLHRVKQQINQRSLHKPRVGPNHKRFDTCVHDDLRPVSLRRHRHQAQ